ncbi:hypothetical protein CLI76_09985 [Porphyromonas gingivalis]|nr:hypothetical protein CLI80_04785 [Porphyromonas gingivalis]PDP76399.1 hypothetical protein CLI76_09985 [Porphyromonas gingivalis]
MSFVVISVWGKAHLYLLSLVLFAMDEKMDWIDYYLLNQHTFLKFLLILSSMTENIYTILLSEKRYWSNTISLPSPKMVLLTVYLLVQKLLIGLLEGK